MIVQVNVVLNNSLNRTVVDSDCRFDNLCGSYLVLILILIYIIPALRDQPYLLLCIPKE